MEKLEEDNVQGQMEGHLNWKLDQGALVREWTFRNFIEAMGFVDGVAKLAESAEHHPDIDIRYNLVRLGLVTHDAGGITQRDVDMAIKLDEKFGA